MADQRSTQNNHFQNVRIAGHHLEQLRRQLLYWQQRYDSLVFSLIGTTNAKTVPERTAALAEAHAKILQLQEQIFDAKLAALRQELMEELRKATQPLWDKII